jgi:hypothetical protein
MSSADPLVAMRCADAREKACSSTPALLLPHKAALLRLLSPVTRPELPWYLALMVPRLPCGLAQAKKVFS